MSPCAPILLIQSLIPHARELTQHIQYEENPHAPACLASAHGSSFITRGRDAEERLWRGRWGPGLPFGGPGAPAGGSSWLICAGLRWWQREIGGARQSSRGWPGSRWAHPRGCSQGAVTRLGGCSGRERVLSWHQDAQPPGKGLGSLTFTHSPPASQPQGRRALAHSQDPSVSLWMWTRIHPGLDYAHEHGACQPQNPGATPAASQAQVPTLGCVGSASAPGNGMGCRGTPNPGGPRPLRYLQSSTITPCFGWTFVPPHASATGG